MPGTGSSRVGPGHAAWTLTFRGNGKLRFERIPRDWVEEIGKRVAAGPAFQEAAREELAAIAQLPVPGWYPPGMFARIL